MTERSCGTIPYTVRGGKLFYLLVKAKDDGPCGFPKGHVEDGESEIETALRETLEETSLRPIISDSFRYEISYELKKDEKHSFFRFFDYVGGFLVGLALGYAAVIGLSILTRTAFQVIVAFDSSVQVMPIYENSFVFKFLAEFDTFGAINSLFQTVSSTIQNILA